MSITTHGPTPDSAGSPEPEASAAETEKRPDRPSRLHRRALARFRRFRRTRPFWGALVAAAGGYLIAKPVLGGSMEFYTSVGARGITPLILGGGIIAASLIALVVPAQRHFPAIMGVMLSIASLPMANLGGLNRTGFLGGS